MTNEKAKKMLKAKLECLKRETSGINHDCNMRLCDGCSLNYEQGNMGEQKEALQMAIKALEQQPCDAISREEAIRIAEQGQIQGHEWQFKKLCNLPSVTPKPKIGHWIAEINDYGEVMRWHCDKCYEDSGFTTTCKWDFCPNCGAKMEVEK